MKLLVVIAVTFLAAPAAAEAARQINPLGPDLVTVIQGRGQDRYPAVDFRGGARNLRDSSRTWTKTLHGETSAIIEPGGHHYRLTTRGSSWSWGLDINAHVVSYWQRLAGRYQIHLYDWKTRQSVPLPVTVNDPSAQQYQPSISGDKLTFVRRNSHGRRTLFLYNLTSGRLTRLASHYGPLINGQVTGDWVVWNEGFHHHQDWIVYRHQITTGRTEQIAHRAGKVDRAPGVAVNGTMYFFRSDRGCGRSDRLIIFTASDYRRVAGTLTGHLRVGKLWVAREFPPGVREVYFDVDKCSGGHDWYVDRAATLSL